MSRFTQVGLGLLVAAGVVALAAGFAAGRATGGSDAPQLTVPALSQISLPAAQPVLVVPSPLTLPSSLKS